MFKNRVENKKNLFLIPSLLSYDRGNLQEIVLEKNLKNEYLLF